MRIVLDANILIAALLGSRGKIAILTSQNHEFYAPSYIIAEIQKYRQEICEKIGCSLEEFNKNFEALLVFVKVIDEQEYAPNIPRAIEVMKDRDCKDAHYIACALTVQANFIWTEDKDFSGQTLVAVKTTEKFIEEGREQRYKKFSQAQLLPPPRKRFTERNNKDTKSMDNQETVFLLAWRMRSSL